MKSQIRNAFNRASSSYERSAVVQKEVAGICAGLVVPGSYSRVVEIGAGAGFLASALMPNIRTRQYIVLDIAEQMVRKQVFTCDPFVPVVGDGEMLPLRPESVDLLVSASAMQWYLAPSTSLVNNLALLRAGGRFALALFVKGTLGELDTVREETGFGSLFPMQSVDLYEEILAGIAGIRSTISLRSLIVWHDSVKDFLRAHRETGARYTSGKGRLGRRAYMDFCRVYEEMFGRNGRVPATYETVFIHGEKEGGDISPNDVERQCF